MDALKVVSNSRWNERESKSQAIAITKKILNLTFTFLSLIQ